MKGESIYIKINDIIKIIDKAAEQQLISRKAAEMIIYEIYKETDGSKYKRI